MVRSPQLNQHLQASHESGLIPCWAPMARVPEVQR